MKTDGYFYTEFKKNNPGYSQETFRAAEDAVSKLLNPPTSDRVRNPMEHPGVLLGKVQSGKTRTYVTVLTLAFDNGYDVAFVLTKCSRPLLKQTQERLQGDLKAFDGDGVLTVSDIMQSHETYRAAEFDQKLIFVCKKEDDNLNRLRDFVINHQKHLTGKKILFIDDEGDTASVSYCRREGEVFANVIPTQISDIRGLLSSYSYLSVTATPYSLYLQPTNVEVYNVSSFKPVRPLFTVLTPIGEGYIGGEAIFRTQEHDPKLNALRPHLFIPIRQDEVERLKKQDRRSFREENILANGNYEGFCTALINFIVGGAMARIPKKEAGTPGGKLRYAFVVHTEMAKLSHSWQVDLAEEYIAAFKAATETENAVMKKLLRHSYDQFAATLRIDEKPVPAYEKVVEEVHRALRDEDIAITKVNSEKDLISLLDLTGQLKLRVTYNIFIGGQVMDRGVTIGNLIGFYYGRRPKRAQQDTVIQHQRMYGYRREDIAVTRLYTTSGIFQTMARMEEFDHALRESVRKQLEGGGDGSVHFIQRSQDGKIIPCSPNKVLASQTEVLRSGKRILPIGFQTKYKTEIAGVVSDLDRGIGSICGFNQDAPTLVSVQTGIQLLKRISITLENGPEDEASPFDWSVAYDVMAHLSEQSSNNINKGKIWLWTARGRELGRKKQCNKIFQDSPDSPQTEGKLWSKYAIDNPILFLLRQEGGETQGWRGCPFYWPVMQSQKNTLTSVYATETIQNEIPSSLLVA